MNTPSLARLAPVALLCVMTACSASPQDTPGPTSTPEVTAPSGPGEPVDTGPASPDPAASTSASPATGESAPPTASESAPPTASEAAPPDGIPAVIQGRWITVGQGETPRPCTEELDAEGAILTIDATRISSFAFLFELESIEESDADSMVGLFAYHDDSDELMTPEIKLETTDDWKTLEFIELGTEGQAPALYSRCS